jgi:hypothetical protein
LHPLSLVPALIEIPLVLLHKGTQPAKKPVFENKNPMSISIDLDTGIAPLAWLSVSTAIVAGNNK